MDEIPETRDSLLIRVADARDQAAWEQFARIYRPVVYNVARMRGLQDADAQDVAQQVLVSVSKALPNWERRNESTRFRHWLCRMARNATINMLTRQPKDRAAGGDINLVDIPERSFDNDLDLQLDREYRRQLFRQAAELVRTRADTITWQAFAMTMIDGLSVTEAAERLQRTEAVVSVAKANDQTSPPQSDAEKAIARLVLVFFQDEARRAVPGLMIDHGAETLILTTGPATIVPDGVAHATSRTYLEFPETADVKAKFIDTKTADVFFHRAKSGLTTFKLEKTVDLKVRDGLSAILLSGQPTLRVTPNAARISALNQATSFSLATHKFRHDFTGLIQIDQRLPEGTPPFKDGELAGITLLGARFMKDDVPGSYVVPASRIFEVLRQMTTE